MTDVLPGVSLSSPADGSWPVGLAGQWNVGRNQNGGVLLSAVSTALSELTGHPHPLAVTGHYPPPAEAAPAVVRTALVKPGRTYATATGELWQDDKERLQV